MTFAIVVGMLLAAPAQAPKIEVPAFGAPTRTAVPSTPSETAILQAGYALLQQQKIDDAIADYQKVLAGNPANVTAMYEIAAALVEKRDYVGAVAMALKTTEYAGAHLADSYALIGSVFDMTGEPAKAIDTYDRAIARLPNSGTLYYNKAITQLQSLNDPAAAIATLKQGAVADPGHAGTQLLLGKYFLAQDLQTPAFMALSRFLIDEPGSRRTGEGFQSWYGLLNSGVKTGADGKGQIAVNPNKSRAEGDLVQMDMYFALSQMSAASMPGTTPPGDRLATQIDMLIGVWSAKDPKSDATSFLWTYYMPYFKEMRDKKFVQPFVYYVCQHAGLPGASEWLTAHGGEVQAFLDWNKNFAFR